MIEALILAGCYLCLLFGIAETTWRKLMRLKPTEADVWLWVLIALLFVARELAR